MPQRPPMINATEMSEEQLGSLSSESGHEVAGERPLSVEELHQMVESIERDWDGLTVVAVDRQGSFHRGREGLTGRVKLWNGGEKKYGPRTGEFAETNWLPVQEGKLVTAVVSSNSGEDMPIDSFSFVGDGPSLDGIAHIRDLNKYGRRQKRDLPVVRGKALEHLDKEGWERILKVDNLSVNPDGTVNGVMEIETIGESGFSIGDPRHLPVERGRVVRTIGLQQGERRFPITDASSLRFNKTGKLEGRVSIRGGLGDSYTYHLPVIDGVAVPTISSVSGKISDETIWATKKVRVHEDGTWSGVVAVADRRRNTGDMLPDLPVVGGKLVDQIEGENLLGIVEVEDKDGKLYGTVLTSDTERTAPVSRVVVEGRFVDEIDGEPVTALTGVHIGDDGKVHGIISLKDGSHAFFVDGDLSREVGGQRIKRISALGMHETIWSEGKSSAIVETEGGEKITVIDGKIVHDVIDGVKVRPLSVEKVDDQGNILDGYVGIQDKYEYPQRTVLVVGGKIVDRIGEAKIVRGVEGVYSEGGALNGKFEVEATGPQYGRGRTRVYVDVVLGRPARRTEVFEL